MALDPQAKALLEQFEAAGAQPFETMTPAQARVAVQGFKMLGGRPEHVRRVDHEYVPGPTADLPVRIYWPAMRARRPSPALIYFHGSGFVLANIGICDSFCRALANRTRCAVIAVNYQKAPEHKFPIPFDDCYAATQWVFMMANEFGLDKRRIGVIGDSAGGNLAAAVTLRARDEGGPELAYQVLVYPSVQYGWDTASCLEYAEGYSLQRASVEYFWNHYVNDPSDGQNPYCSPLLAEDHSNLPPAFIAIAECDPIADDGRHYAAKLEVARVPVTFQEYEGMIHGFMWMGGALHKTRILLDDIGREVRRAIA